MSGLGYKVYDLQTVEPWFERSRHAHNERRSGRRSGVITFHSTNIP